MVSFSTKLVESWELAFWVDSQEHLRRESVVTSSCVASWGSVGDFDGDQEQSEAEKIELLKKLKALGIWLSQFGALFHPMVEKHHGLNHMMFAYGGVLK
jgi:hypothetical protein